MANYLNLNLLPIDVLKLGLALTKQLYVLIQEDTVDGDNVRGRSPGRRLCSDVIGVYSELDLGLVALLQHYCCPGKPNEYDAKTRTWAYHCRSDYDENDAPHYRCYLQEMRLNEARTNNPFVYTFVEIHNKSLDEWRCRLCRYRRLSPCFLDRWDDSAVKTEDGVTPVNVLLDGTSVAEMDTSFQPPSLAALTDWNWDQFWQAYHKNMAEDGVGWDTV